jgi:hypothetical protein
MGLEAQVTKYQFKSIFLSIYLCAAITASRFMVAGSDEPPAARILVEEKSC